MRIPFTLLTPPAILLLLVSNHAWASSQGKGTGRPDSPIPNPGALTPKSKKTGMIRIGEGQFDQPAEFPPQSTLGSPASVFDAARTTSQKPEKVPSSPRDSSEKEKKKASPIPPPRPSTDAPEKKQFPGPPTTVARPQIAEIQPGAEISTDTSPLPTRKNKAMAVLGIEPIGVVGGALSTASKFHHNTDPGVLAVKEKERLRGKKGEDEQIDVRMNPIYQGSRTHESKLVAHTAPSVLSGQAKSSTLQPPPADSTLLAAEVDAACMINSVFCHWIDVARGSSKSSSINLAPMKNGLIRSMKALSDNLRNSFFCQYVILHLEAALFLLELKKIPPEIVMESIVGLSNTIKGFVKKYGDEVIAPGAKAKWPFENAQDKERGQILTYVGTVIENQKKKFTKDASLPDHEYQLGNLEKTYDAVIKAPTDTASWFRLYPTLKAMQRNPLMYETAVRVQLADKIDAAVEATEAFLRDLDGKGKKPDHTLTTPFIKSVLTHGQSLDPLKDHREEAMKTVTRWIINTDPQPGSSPVPQPGAKLPVPMSVQPGFGPGQGADPVSPQVASSDPVEPSGTPKKTK